MSIFKKRRIYQYINKFGLYYGLISFFNVRRAKSKDMLSFKVPGLKENIFLRRKSSDFFVFEEIFIEERYKLSTHQEIKYIVDAGANIGLAALYFTKLFPSAKIICIEPEASNFEILKKNTINYPNIIRYHAGLWNKKCFLKIINAEDASWAFIVEETPTKKNNLFAIAMEDILLENPTETIDLIKIDIEGSEKEVFEKNIEWIAKTRNLIVELHEDIRNGARQSVMNALKDFDCKKILENYFFSSKIR